MVKMIGNPIQFGKNYLKIFKQIGELLKPKRKTYNEGLNDNNPYEKENCIKTSFMSYNLPKICMMPMISEFMFHLSEIIY